MSTSIRKASCACGQLRAECVGEPAKVSVCHCLECQRRTGSAFGVAVFYRHESVQATGQASIYMRPSDGGFDVEHHFCPKCGSTVFWYPSRKPDFVALGLGCFAGPTFSAPHQQVYEKHRHSWVSLELRGR